MNIQGSIFINTILLIYFQCGMVQVIQLAEPQGNIMTGTVVLIVNMIFLAVFIFYWMNEMRDGTDRISEQMKQLQKF
jgi:uncharacterized membrane protein